MQLESDTATVRIRLVGLFVWLQYFLLITFISCTTDPAVTLSVIGCNRVSILP